MAAAPTKRSICHNSLVVFHRSTNIIGALLAAQSSVFLPSNDQACDRTLNDEYAKLKQGSLTVRGCVRQTGWSSLALLLYNYTHGLNRLSC